MSSSKKIEQAAKEKNRVEAGTLYLVATPIGNLGDLSERAIKVLSEVDFIAAEDTRNSMRLLTHLGISRPMVSYFEHNKRERGEQIADHEYVYECSKVCNVCGELTRPEAEHAYDAEGSERCLYCKGRRKEACLGMHGFRQGSIPHLSQTPSG